MATDAPPATLWEALDLDAVAVPVVAIVGGGGKTALLYRLGREAAASGRRAVLAGTARFTRAPHGAMPPLVSAEDAVLPQRLRAALAEHLVVAASSGDEPQGRLGAVSPGTAGAIAALPGLGLLALEADGSKLRPFKAPGEHEPVIPPAATHVVAVVGLDALGAPLDDEHVHRPERVRAIVGDVERCDADAIARVLASPLGGRKDVGSRRFAVLVNKADLGEPRALELAEAVLAAGVARVVVASLHDEARPVRATLGRAGAA
jgi:probable selenium-dependent hydroxylase accessory protein YqeC